MRGRPLVPSEQLKIRGFGKIASVRTSESRRATACPLCRSEGHYAQTSTVDANWDTLTRGQFRLMRCNSCGLQYSDPMVPRPAAQYAGLEWYGPRWEFARLFDVADLHGRTILEVGCGEGYFLEIAKMYGGDLIGLDFNSAALLQASSRAGKAALRPLTLDEYFAENPSSQPHCIAFFHVLEHVPDIHAFFSVATSHLEPGGILAFSVPSPRRVDLKLGERESWDYPPHHLTRWSENAIRVLLRKYDLDLVALNFEPLTPGYLHGALTVRLSNPRALVSRMLRPFTREIAHAMYWASRIFRGRSSAQAVLVVARKRIRGSAPASAKST
jgi:2-polyprenyl-3-methyl-5-hydroxy-6-metoxy-1,4-benzoquinol methylase